MVPMGSKSESSDSGSRQAGRQAGRSVPGTTPGEVAADPYRLTALMEGTDTRPYSQVTQQTNLLGMILRTTPDLMDS
jgi:hypothetical protein